MASAQSPGQVRTVRYEEATPGKAPIPVTSATHTNLTPEALAAASAVQPPPTRPLASPAVKQSPRVSQFSEDFKRDSAIASSPRSATRTSPKAADSAALAAVTAAVNGSPKAKRGETPTIQEEERKPRPSFVGRRPRKITKQKAVEKELSPPEQLKRLSSFKGLQTSIPDGGLQELDAGNFGFSQRGSILFGGKKMDDLFALGLPDVAAEQNKGMQQTDHGLATAVAMQEAQIDSDLHIPPQKEAQIGSDAYISHHGRAQIDSDVHIPIQQKAAAPEITALSPQQPPQEAQPPTVPIIVEPDATAEDDKIFAQAVAPQKDEQTTSTSPARLAAGPRNPSVQMLQAAIEGGRVLSAEEITFSMKVRSMYEAGDESAADWSTPGKATPETTFTKDSTEISERSEEKSPRIGATSRASRLSQDIRASYQHKPSHETAGGIEDWQDINSTDVDRYGFIVQRKPGERPTSSIADITPSEGLHRVATGLRLAADQPRRRGMTRTPSASRSSKSVPPQGSVRPSSLNSGTSAAASIKSRRSAFRSKHRRITDAAGDMLTLPPGLADIAEQGDEGQALAQLRRREWARNEKWQKMARPLVDRSQNSGGGMHFDFDTDDAKLVSRTWKGIPDRWRATAWHSFLSTSARRRGNYEPDRVLIQKFRELQDVNCAEDYQIDMDVPRTISMHVMFRRRYRGGQRLLFRVLHAIALYFPETSYVQGMASLAATLLCYFDEERAFVMMVRMWQLRGLEQLFQPGFAGLMTALSELEQQWLAGSDLAKKLDELTIAPTSYGTRWYLTLFNMSIPFPAQLRVWDVFMLLGDATPVGKGAFGGADLDVLHATSTALIDATREIILDSDFENAMKVLTSFVPIRDEDLLMRVARAEWKLGKKRKGAAGAD